MTIEDIKQELRDARAIVYCLRHQESTMLDLGGGDATSRLTPKGRREAHKLRALLDKIGTIDEIVSGDIPRHTKTVCQFGGGYQLRQDDSINALEGGDLFSETDKSVVEEKYGLERFKPGEDGLYHADGFSFDPDLEQVLPYEFYTTAIVSRRLRSVVFDSGSPLTTFEEMEQRVRDFEEGIVAHLDSDHQSTILAVVSCSAFAYVLEYAKYGTTGENIVQYLEGEPPYSVEQVKAYRNAERLYPHGLDEISVLYVDDANRINVHFARQPVGDYLHE